MARMCSMNKLRVMRLVNAMRNRNGLASSGESMEEIELVSTQMLKALLSSRDKSERCALREAINTAEEGVLARHPVTGRFEIIGGDELRAILDANRSLPKITVPADATVEPLRDYVDDEHMALVSTRALRKVLRDDDDDLRQRVDTAANHFNPYEKG